MEEIEINNAITNAYSCNGCGAPLVYKPGSTNLVCKHCGSTKQIEQEEVDIEELDFDRYMQDFVKEDFVNSKIVICSNCKATPTVDENLKSMSCPYCGSPLVESDMHMGRYIRPGYVAPFRIDKDQINNILSTWAKGLFFAPNKLKKAILSSLNLNGIYMPYWTYDAQTHTNYTGERGDAYYVTVGSGDNKRRERRVKWRYANGSIAEFYDDVLVSGSKTLDNSLLQKIGGWNTKDILKINDSYLAGFVTEKYQVDLKDAFVTAKQIIDANIRYSVKSDIGGDEQRIHSISTKYRDITFKHVLLPIYVSSFRYKNKAYAFYVNGCTGTISGKRPYSAVKITLAAIAGLIVCGLIYYWINNAQ